MKNGLAFLRARRGINHICVPKMMLMAVQAPPAAIRPRETEPLFARRAQVKNSLHQGSFQA